MTEDEFMAVKAMRLRGMEAQFGKSADEQQKLKRDVVAHNFAEGVAEGPAVCDRMIEALDKELAPLLRQKELEERFEKAIPFILIFGPILLLFLFVLLHWGIS